jgi:hypothetical protein
MNDGGTVMIFVAQSIVTATVCYLDVGPDPRDAMKQFTRCS